MVTETEDFRFFLPSNWTSLISCRIIGNSWKIVQLDENFIKYIESDGIMLPDNDDEECTSEDGEHDFPSDFPEVHENISRAFHELGKCVVPKLNWTSPKDSIWISANTLKCTSVSDIYMLLKASDRISDDLNLAKDLSISNCELFLRKYEEMNPNYEFRCFVSERRIIAICQRNLDTFCEALFIENRSIVNKLSNFFSRNFADFPIGTYSFDAYVNDCVVSLVDINPLNDNSDFLLYTKEEIKRLSSEKSEEPPQLKFIENVNDTEFALAKRNFLPVDLFHMTSSDITNLNFDEFTR